MFPRNCLLMFYNSYAKTLIKYGIIAYGATAKTNLSKIVMAQRRIMRAIFFKKKMDSITDFLREKGILTVYELYLAELLKELFRQLRSEAPNTYLPENLESNSTNTRGKTKGLLPSIFSRALTKKKSLANGLRKAYNWLTELKLLPTNIKNMTRPQVRHYVKPYSPCTLLTIDIFFQCFLKDYLILFLDGSSPKRFTMVPHLVLKGGN